MPRNEPANISVAPNSPSARPHASARPAIRLGPAAGIATRSERPRLAGAERARGVEPGPVERLEARLRLAQVERRRDERERDDHPGGGQHELDAGVLDQAAEHAAAARAPPAAPIPATAGGSTSGSSTSVTTAARPRKRRVASK